MKSGVQSQEDVNIPVSFRSMQIVRGIYVIEQCEYQCLIQYFGPMIHHVMIVYIYIYTLLITL